MIDDILKHIVSRSMAFVVLSVLRGSEKSAQEDTEREIANLAAEAKLQLFNAVMKEIIGEPLDYEKYGQCPACTASMMYQCSCDSGSLYTITQQRSKARKLFDIEESKPE
jgi:hypothetical protein